MAVGLNRLTCIERRRRWHSCRRSRSRRRGSTRSQRWENTTIGSRADRHPATGAPGSSRIATARTPTWWWPFDSYELAMENSNRPETHALARKMSELVDCPPTYGNYDVNDQ